MTVLYQRLLDRLAGELHFGSPALRAAFFAVPRHRFIPEVIWVDDRTGYTAVSRSIDPSRWMHEVLTDTHVITQVDDGRAPPRPGARGTTATCSASQPSLVFAMLDEAALRHGVTVLELGTGTGYNAGLLASVCGDVNVVTVEIDTHLRATARDNLGKVGQLPTVIRGDGADGYPPWAPYDRVIATYAVNRIPHAWVEQTIPGGVLVIPWGAPYFHGALLRLTVQFDGSAIGRFTGRAAFMQDRNHRVAVGPLRDYVPVEQEHLADVTDTDTDPASVCDNPEAEFFIALSVPKIHQRLCYPRDDSGEYTLWLFDVDGSWASVDYTPGADRFEVNQYGPRRLWKEVETAYRAWVEFGSPPRHRFGVTVTPGQGQRAWLDHPEGARFL